MTKKPNYIKNLGEVRRGDKHPFYGKHRSEETKAKISEGMKGRIPWNKGIKQSLDRRIKTSLFKRKNKTNNWDGFISSGNKNERNKFKRLIQKQIFERDDYTCQLCGVRGVALQVDHIQSWAQYVELRFNMDNCRTLCMDCHYQITFNKPKPKNIIWGHNFKNIKLS